MLAVQEIIRTAVREHDEASDVPENLDSFVDEITEKLKVIDQIPQFGHSSKPLSLVRFKCMLQDTGYPMEVYLPGMETAEGESNVASGSSKTDWSKLQERWIGWATQIPGEQKREAGLEDAVGDLSVSDVKPLHESLKVKYPLENKGDYLGALVKVYDETSFKPAALVEFVGILSSSPMPSRAGANEDEDPIMVPCIHVLALPRPATTPFTAAPADAAAIRTKLVDYLSEAFSPPDLLAAEYLLLLLISSPTTRPTSLPPLGTMSLNLISPSSSRSNLNKTLKSLMEMVVALPLSIPLLHSASFQPHSPDSTTLNAGTLQLGDGTVLVVEEDAMGQGGKLEEKAIKNLKALSDCMTTQTLGYEYPYMDSLRMNCAIRGLVVSEGKSLLPVDISLPISAASSSGPDPQGSGSAPSLSDLDQFRAYLSCQASSETASKLDIPDEIATMIQESFVANRKANGGDPNDAEGRLKRQMRIARLLALSHVEAKLTEGVWKRAVEMDEQAETRLSELAKTKGVATSKQVNGNGSSH